MTGPLDPPGYVRLVDGGWSTESTSTSIAMGASSGCASSSTWPTQRDRSASSRPPTAGSAVWPWADSDSPCGCVGWAGELILR